jgi:hypothetical protein
MATRKIRKFSMGGPGYGPDLRDEMVRAREKQEADKMASIKNQMYGKAGPAPAPGRTPDPTPARAGNSGARAIINNIKDRVAEATKKQTPVAPKNIPMGTAPKTKAPRPGIDVPSEEPMRDDRPPLVAIPGNPAPSRATTPMAAPTATAPGGQAFVKGAPYVNDEPAGGYSPPTPAMKRGGKVKAYKAGGTVKSESKPAVKGWGMARGARPAKIC